jgi:hypothetical protein
VLRLLLAALVCAALLSGRPARSDEGMWPFNHLPRAELQQKYGFIPSDAWLTHVRRSSLRIGGGSGSLVSSRGLVLTNHHCVEDCISRLSSPSRDYQMLGFYAKTAELELPCPGLSVQQLDEITDVTAGIAALTRGLAGAAFQQALRAEKARLEQACRTDAGSSCELVSLYHGGLYELYRYRRYADVRLVFAPERDAALFGGDPDNFSFPRYDLDLALLRVYTDGKAALTPDHLAWSRSGLSPNELSFVSGNPGSTERLRTVSELEFLRDRGLVKELLLLAQYRGFLNEYAERGAEAKRVASTETARVENTLKELAGARAALASRSFFAGVVERENQLRARVASRPGWQTRYGAAWDAIAKAQAQAASLADDWLWMEGPPGFRPPWAKTQLFGFARTLVRVAAERLRSNEDRLEEFTNSIDAAARAVRARYENEIQSELTRNAELIAQARFEVYGMSSYPDATASPRLAFGTVRGWRESGKLVPAFTTLGGVFERQTGRWPFALPPNWLAHRNELALDTPFNFVTDADIVGGNSGSPVLNRQGELVGLIFDGNLPSLGGAFGFDIATNRAVALDVRAIAHTLERIYLARRLTEELLGGAP